MTTPVERYQRACAIIPGGVSSPVRAFRAVGGTPVFVASASGPHVTDADGRTYVDLVCSWGPALLGHAHPGVVEAVRAAASRGLSFGAPTQGEVELAEAIQARVPYAQRVRFVSTGTEATMTAVRLARGATGRDLIVKFAGCYHGHSDALLAAAGSGVATAGLPGSAGVTRAAAADTIVLEYNDFAALEALFAARGDEIAAVITEAAPANMGVVPPEPGFNAAIRRLTAARGALMISDEVLTGFRVHRAGWWGLESSVRGAEGAKESGSAPEIVEGSGPKASILAADATPWTPDLVTFGKVVGGGMPLAALAGRADLMSLLAPLGPVYQAGTLSGNPLATAAGLATLDAADEAVYAHVNAVADTISAALDEALDAAGVPHRVQRAGSLFSAFLGEATTIGVRDYAQAQRQDAFRYAPFFWSMLRAGVALPPSAFEAWFVSAAHDDQAVQRVLAALPDAARAAAAAERPA